MNIILIDDFDFIKNSTVKISGRRFTHISTVINPKVGNKLKLGKFGGEKFSAEVVSINKESIELKLLDDSTPPVAKLPVKLIVALPRPKTIKKLIPYVVSMGIKELYLINSWRVEKSYWTSPVLAKRKIEELIKLGLEQAGDTIPINIAIRKRFKPFVEDEIPGIIENCNAYLPHLGNFPKLESSKNSKESVVIIGPEGGFIQYEVDMLRSNGFKAVSLGERVLRVEVAAITAISKLCI